jgi:hypothetical protein
MDRQGPAFAQDQKPQGVVQVRVGDQDGFHACPTGCAGARQQRGEVLDLNPDIGRSVQQKPTLAVSADGGAGLGAGTGLLGIIAGGLAAPAIAVPLGEPAAGGRTKEANSQESAPAKKIKGTVSGNDPLFIKTISTAITED